MGQFEFEPAKWGVVDASDGKWIGNKDGPYLFDLPELAQTAAVAVAFRMQWPPQRVEVRRWTGWGKPKVGAHGRLYES